MSQFLCPRKSSLKRTELLNTKRKSSLKRTEFASDLFSSGRAVRLKLEAEDRRLFQCFVL